MTDFIYEAGWGIYPVFLFGFSTLGLALLHAVRPKERWMPLISGAGLSTVLAGVLGTATGLQHSVMYIDHVAASERWVFLIGLKESLNNLVAALVLVVLATLLTSFGSYRIKKSQEGSGTTLNPAPSAG